MWWWLRLVAVSDLLAEAALRMEAGLAYRAVTGMRPGPVRARWRPCPRTGAWPWGGPWPT